MRAIILHPRKHFGQHFLQDTTVIQRIIETFQPTATQHIIEIGPGKGALTIPLLNIVPTLVAIEYDAHLATMLAEKHATLLMHQADVLTVNFETLKTDERPLRIIGNLPYNITTPLLFHLFTYQSMIKDMLFMVQKEVALRLSATPNHKCYGRLSIMAQYYCAIERLFDVPPQAFYPKPKVTSSVIRLTPHRTLPYLATHPKHFASLVKQAFSQRRKILKNSLQSLIDEQAWIKLATFAHQRPEQLTIKEFVEISNYVSLNL